MEDISSPYYEPGSPSYEPGSPSYEKTVPSTNDDHHMNNDDDTGVCYTPDTSPHRIMESPKTYVPEEDDIRNVMNILRGGKRCTIDHIQNKTCLPLSIVVDILQSEGMLISIDDQNSNVNHVKDILHRNRNMSISRLMHECPDICKNELIPILRKVRGGRDRQTSHSRNRDHNRRPYYTYDHLCVKKIMDLFHKRLSMDDQNYCSFNDLMILGEEKGRLMYHLRKLVSRGKLTFRRGDNGAMTWIRN